MLSTSLNRAMRAVATVVAATALVLGGAVAAQAQQGTVAGTVTDQSSLQPLAGAQVFVPGTQLGTLTGQDGKFRITGVPAGTQTVRVRLIGYKSAVKQVTVEANQTVTTDFQLSISAVSLEEVVVTTTGEHQKRSLGTNISTIDVSQEVQKSESNNIQDVLRGRASGVTIRSSSGSVGTGTEIKVRGPSSLSLGTTPLLYVDGVQVSNSNSTLGGMSSGRFFTGGQGSTRWNDINPEDIQSIDVLKGPAAVTLYGPGAAGGVILITTKHGTASQATRYTFRAQVGGNWDATGGNFQGLAYDPARAFLAGPSDFYQPVFGITPKDTVYLMNLMRGAAGIEPPFRTGLTNTYAGTMSGSSNPFNYFFSAQYQNLEGNLPSNTVQQWNGRGNFSAKPSDKVTLDVSTGFTSNNTALPQNDNNSFGYIGQALIGRGYNVPFDRADPLNGGSAVRTCPLAFEASRDAGANSAFGGLSGLSDALCGKPFFGLTFKDVALVPIKNDVQRFTGSSTLTYRPLDFWTNRFTAGYDEYSTKNQFIEPVVPRLSSFDSDFGGGFVQLEHDHNQLLTLTATSTVDATLTQDIGSQTTAGAQFFDDKGEGTYAQGRGFPPGTPSVGASTTNQGDDSFSEQKTLGIFGHQQFSWKDRLFVSGGVRMDNNSAFGPSLGLQVVPQVSVSYVVSDESWFPKVFDQFKVRGAWGKSTKQPPTNSAFALLTPVSVPLKSGEALGVTPNRPGNDSLRPETDTEIEVGADLSLLAGRLSGSFTWYHDVNKNAIVQEPLPPSSGFPGSVFTNVGEMRNKGIEAQLNAIALDMPDLTWEWTVQASTNYNVITDLPNPITFGFAQRHQQGHEFGSYYSQVVNVTNAGLAVSDTPQILNGAPTPNLTGSLGSTITLFSHVTLYGLMDFASGQQLLNDTQQFACAEFVVCPEVYQVNSSGQLTQEARIKELGSPAAANIEAPFMENAYYAKLRTVSLRVDLPGDWLRPFGAHGAAFTLVGNNLATWTGYTGADPELNGAGQSSAFRTDFLTLPPARSVTASVSVTF